MVKVVMAFLKANGRETSHGMRRRRAAKVRASTAADHAKAVTNSNSKMVVRGKMAAWSAPAAASAPSAAPNDPAQPPSVDARYCAQTFHIII